ncbi:leucine--tRNA ligase [Candidatus Parcubacteria bacterium]|nr:MAG: leucine--tRNA ligase [Candidatus Parcubacteria bacterium]
MKRYNPKEIEKKWQKLWEENGFYKAVDFDKKPKYYTLFEFPYPSGDGLHVGHARPYTAMDAYARSKRMQGYNVLFPIGWDAFGLPTENYAIANKIHPRVATERNVKNFKRQMKMLGLSLDWSREVNTTDPKYYKWTQWIFLQLYKAGLAYRAEISINWCPKCKVGLANEEVVNGKHERCGTPVEKKVKKQWLFAITKYADRLLKDLDTVDYPERVRNSQINWIGRSEGALIKFPISPPKADRPRADNFQFSKEVEVFTTRADTLFGVTFIVVSPELAKQWIDLGWKAPKEVSVYIKKAIDKSELERQENKEKTGVDSGIVAIHPLSKKEIPVWVADYVLAGYGTGAVMGVPAHDERDFEFATKFKLPIIEVVSQDGKVHSFKKAYEGDGVMVNSEGFNGLKSKEGGEKIIKELEKLKVGKSSVNYKLRDWVFSRQHYWGEPIPIIYCKKCGEVAVDEKDLPVLLPDVKHYEPTDTGESPLADIKEWVNVKCPKCDEPAKRETDTMPNWAGSNWYYLAYLMQGISNFQFPISKYKEVFKYWMPIDLYDGGMEHTTLHLLYSRFIYKFLYDKGFVPTAEPYAIRRSHGVVLAEDGRKMSKSYKNVITPDDVVDEFGADTLRLYEMFMAPFDQMVPWSSRSVIGVHRFLDRLWKFYNGKINEGKNEELENGFKKLISKITEDLNSLKFNTAVAAFMEFSNKMIKAKTISKNVLENYLKLFAPFAPHITEELWQKLGHKESINLQNWPKAGEVAKETEITLVVQINGRVRDTIKVKVGISQNEAEKFAMNSEKIKKYLGSQKPKKVIFTGKLINLVV